MRLSEPIYKIVIRIFGIRPGKSACLGWDDIDRNMGLRICFFQGRFNIKEDPL